jgi:hypothetical protein
VLSPFSHAQYKLTGENDDDDSLPNECGLSFEVGVAGAEVGVVESRFSESRNSLLRSWIIFLQFNFEGMYSRRSFPT